MRGWLSPAAVVWISLPFFLAGLSGCATDEPTEDDRVRAHLQQIVRAYASPEQRPRDMEQLRSSVSDMHAMGLGVPADQAMVSPRDNQPFVVIFEPDASATGDAILAYEQQGRDGKRWVVTMSGDIRLLADAEFSQATFAKKRPPTGK